MRYFFLIAAILSSVLITSSGVALAQSSDTNELDNSGLPGANVVYPLQARDLEIERALRLFARNLGIGLRIEGEVEGTIVEALPSTLTRLEYLDELALRYDFLWYFDGLILIVSDLDNLETEVFAMQTNTGEGVINMLKSLGVYRGRFQHMLDSRRNAFLVSGPAAYVERVSQAIKAMEEADRADITVMRGSNNSISLGGGSGPAPLGGGSTPTSTGGPSAAPLGSSQ